MTTEDAVEATPLESPLASWRMMMQSFGLLAVSEGVARLVSFLAIIWMTRHLSLSGFGVVSLGTNLVVWFAMITNSSRAIGLRDAAQTPHRFKEITEPLLGVRLALAVVAMVGLAATALVVGQNGQDREVLLLFILVLPMLSLNLRFSVLAVGSAKPVAVGNIISQLVFAGGVFLLVNGPNDAIFVPISQASGEFVFAVILIAAMARRYGMLIPRVNRGIWQRNLRESAPLMGQQAARATINWYDSFLIALLLGQAQVGLYSAAYRPIFFTTYSISLLFTAFFAAYNSARQQDTRDMLLSRTVRVSAVISVLAAVVLSAGAPLIVSALYPHDYAAAAAPLAILAWTIPLIGTGSCFGLVLISHKRQNILMWHSFAGVALNVLANFAAVPLFGVEGAAAVTVASLLLITTLNYRSCTRLGFAPSLRELFSRGPLPARPRAADRQTAAIHGNAPGRP